MSNIRRKCRYAPSAKAEDIVCRIKCPRLQKAFRHELKRVFIVCWIMHYGPGIGKDNGALRNIEPCIFLWSSKFKAVREFNRPLKLSSLVVRCATPIDCASLEANLFMTQKQTQRQNHSPT